MTQEFIPYKQALALKELGFDEPCLAYYQKSAVIGDATILPIQIRNKASNFNDNEYSKMGVPFCSAPLYQQAFRWFREKHGLIYSIGHIGHTNTWAYEIINMRIAGPDYGYGETYEEAELECLKKLIEIVKNK